MAQPAGLGHSKSLRHKIKDMKPSLEEIIFVGTVLQVNLKAMQHCGDGVIKITTENYGEKILNQQSQFPTTVLVILSAED